MARKGGPLEAVPPGLLPKIGLPYELSDGTPVQLCGYVFEEGTGWRLDARVARLEHIETALVDAEEVRLVSEWQYDAIVDSLGGEERALFREGGDGLRDYVPWAPRVGAKEQQGDGGGAAVRELVAEARASHRAAPAAGRAAAAAFSPPES